MKEHKEVYPDFMELSTREKINGILFTGALILMLFADPLIDWIFGF